MKQDDEKLGLSTENIWFITAVVFTVLFLFSPLHFLYLVLIPTLLFMGLKHWGSKWKMDKLSNEYLNRAVIACIAGAFLVGAVISFTTNYHFECTQYARDRDGGSECVGDYVRVKGGDKEGGVIQLVLAGIAVWYAVAKRPKNSD